MSKFEKTGNFKIERVLFPTSDAMNQTLNILLSKEYVCQVNGKKYLEE